MANAADSWDLKWELLVADTWDDAALKQRLLDDPATVLKERGISMPEGVSVNVVADDERTVHLTIPAKPSEYALSEEELDHVAGGGGVMTHQFAGTNPLGGTRSQARGHNGGCGATGFCTQPPCR